MKVTSIVVLVALITTALNAGMGFANVTGYLPAMQDTPADHMLSFWQHADHYFRKRMPIFGNGMLLSLVLSVILLVKDWRSPVLWLTIGALIFVAAELVVIFTQNLPVNKIIETLDAEQPLSVDFDSLRNRALTAFYTRAILNFLAFGCMLAAVCRYWTASALHSVGSAH